MASLPLKPRHIPQSGKGILPQIDRCDGDMLIAIHTHLIVRARLAEKAAQDNVRQAFADAGQAGIRPKVMARVLRMLDPAEQALDLAAADVVRAFRAVAIGDVETPAAPGAFSPTLPAATLTVPIAGEAA